MKKKISVLIITILLCISYTLVVNTEVEVEASSGGSGNEEDNGSGLNNSYIWNRLKDFTDVIYFAYNKNDIPRGRSFGSKGGLYTVDNITIPEMNALDLEDIHSEKIEDLEATNKNYTSIINLTDFQLTVNNENYEYPNPIPIKESFVIASGWPNETGGSLTFNNSFENARIFYVSMNDRWPFGGTLTDFCMNVTSYTYLNSYNYTFGNLTYIASDEEVPNDDDQLGRVFLFEDEQETENKLKNITCATGSILINYGSNGVTNSIAENVNCSVVRIDDSDGDQIKELLENGIVFVDDLCGNLTFTYNITAACFPDLDYLGIDRIPDHYELWNISEGFLVDVVLNKFLDVIKYLFPKLSFLPEGNVSYSAYRFGWMLKMAGVWCLNQAIKWLGLPQCYGFILYCSHDYHFMLNPTNDWNKDEKWEPIKDNLRALALQTFTLNYTVGSFLFENRFFTSLTGYANQTFEEETEEMAAVTAYNVIGNITIDESPDDAIAILSNRYDGWWGQTPGDSGVGGAIVLGIAKYMKDYNIKPKYNLTFLFTTGEEYGFRGAWHYSDSHPYDDAFPQKNNIKYWFILDQLAFDQSDTALCLYYKNPAHGDIINESVRNITKYSERTGYGNITFKTDGPGSEQKVASSRENCDSFCFVKDQDYRWDQWHTTGVNYTEGDSLNYIDRNDINVTAELVWNIIKYFLVYPDCWFYGGSANIIDTDDEDDLVDTVTVTFNVKSILPHDLAMVNLTLWRVTTNKIVISEYMNFSVNRSQTSKTINITLPEDEQPGYYVYHLDLYNSTGRINDIVGIEGDNINMSDYSGFFFLYPYGSNITIPIITNVSATPDPVGFGFNVTINVDVTSNVSTIDRVTVNISYPDDTLISYNMTNIVNDTYEFVFNNTWQNGQYDFVIWACDVNGNESGSPQYSFNVSAGATVSVCTVKDSYGDDEIVNLTDPPGSSYLVGYEFLDDGDVLHIWNNLDNYYFNTSSGIQLTNHYNEYWSHNVLMLGYYDNDEWNLIYRTDELCGFNKEIETDNESYVNATLWKNLNYVGYDFRLAIRYHLGINDNELTVMPYIKNIGDEDIPYNLGFAWEIKDIQIDMTEEDDYIEIDGTTYYLNSTGLDETYTNMDIPSFYIKEDTGVDESESLYLCWDENLDYKVQVKSRTGQYNAPVTLGIKIGTLSIGQEKYTSLFWYDACKKTFFYTSYYSPFAWATNPGYMVDGNISNYASTTIDRDVEKCNGNTCFGLDYGTISKVEIRCFGKYSGSGVPPVHNINLKTLGGFHVFSPTIIGNWSSWYDITNDPYAPNPWIWNDVENLLVDVEASIGGLFTMYCSKVEIQVTYNAYPSITNPYPVNGATGIPVSPVLSITVNDNDGDTMNITWLSNSSGSWQTFGQNNSVGNGTYHKMFSNASVNGQWWYWKYNVSDGTNNVVSNPLSFYTGYESKIENTGSTDFKGYLLMQIEFYNTTNSTWVLEQEVVNETTPRTINASDLLALDTIFNPHDVSTGSFSNGDGIYRVYVAFRDIYGDVLVCDDESLMEDNYQFMFSVS